MPKWHSRPRSIRLNDAPNERARKKWDANQTAEWNSLRDPMHRKSHQSVGKKLPTEPNCQIDSVARSDFSTAQHDRPRKFTNRTQVTACCSCKPAIAPASGFDRFVVAVDHHRSAREVKLSQAPPIAKRLLTVGEADPTRRIDPRGRGSHPGYREGLILPRIQVFWADRRC
jgi:hypothetical protein